MVDAKGESSLPALVSRRFEVRSIPTLVLLVHGHVVDTEIGAPPGRQLRSWLDPELPPRAP